MYQSKGYARGGFFNKLLGLYLKNNNYSLSAAKLAGQKPSKVSFTGYRTPIDEYYGAIIRGESAAIPTQRMPQRLAEIVTFLSGSGLEDRSGLASFLLDASGDFRGNLAGAIDRQLGEHRELGRTLPLSAYGDIGLTLFAWSPLVPRKADLAVEHTQVVMAANNESSRPLLELEYTAEGSLCGVHWQKVNLSGLSSTERDRLRAAGTSLRQQRVSKVKALRKIGRNDPCPCGSGKKFKRCHWI